MKVTESEGYGASTLLVILITTFLTGVNGLIAFVFFVIFSRFSFGKDPELKHGLSPGKSRLGGVAILLSIIIGCCSHLVLISNFNILDLIVEINSIILFSFLIGFIGLAEDLSQNISSTSRLLSMIILVSIFLYFTPDLVPMDLTLFKFFGISETSIFIYLFTIIMICGFVFQD